MKDGWRASGKQSQSAAKTLSTFNKLIGYVSLAIIFILLAVAFFLISNTITMGISVRQEEIGIMKLIGATDFFVRVPFVIEGIILGIIGAVIPMAVLYGLYNQVINYVMTNSIFSQASFSSLTYGMYSEFYFRSG